MNKKILDEETKKVVGGSCYIDSEGYFFNGYFHGNGCTGLIKDEGILFWSTYRCTNCHEEHGSVEEYKHYKIYIYEKGNSPKGKYKIVHDDGQVIYTNDRPPELDYPWNHQEKPGKVIKNK